MSILLAPAPDLSGALPAAPPSPAGLPAAPPSPARPRRHLLPWLLAAGFFAAYTALSVRRHERIETTAYDLGIFEQGVRGYASGQPPVSHLRGLNLLGDHFSPVMALLAAPYRLWPDARTLLVAQAALLAVSVVPVARLALHRFGPGTSAVVGIGYGLSWGLQQAVVFDVHEICFAVPLLAFAGEALVARRWTAAVGWALPLLLVKEDLPLTVAALGGYLLLHRRWRLGAAVVAGSAAVAAVVLLVVLPGLNPAGSYGYAASVPTLRGDGPGGLTGLLDGTKAATVLWLLAPTAFVALRSPVLLLCVPTLAWRFLSSNPNYWGMGFHYSAVLMPIVFVAFVDGLHRLAPAGAATSAALRSAALHGCVLVTAAMSLVQPLRQLADDDYWRDGPRVVAHRQALAAVPDGAVVAATNRLAPQLTGRCEVWMFPRMVPGAPEPDWVVADVRRPSWPRPLAEVQGEVRRLRAAGYLLVADREGVVVLRRGPAGPAG